MINVLTGDGHKLFEAIIFASFVVCVPVIFIVCIVYACYILGYTALTGVLTYIIFIPIQVCTRSTAHILLVVVVVVVVVIGGPRRLSWRGSSINSDGGRY